MRVSSSVTALIQQTSTRPCEDCGPNSIKSREERALEDLKSEKAIEKAREARVDDAAPSRGVALESASIAEVVGDREQIAPLVSPDRVQATYRPAEPAAPSFSTET